MNAVIFIDDDFATNIFHKIIIQNSCIFTDYAFFTSPTEVLQSFEAEIQKSNAQYPDLVFLDINMPVLSGWDFLDAYRQLHIPKKSLFFMLSTSHNPRDQENAAIYDGVHTIIKKPLTEQVLKEINCMIKK